MGDDWGDFPVNNRFDDWSAAEGSDPFGGGDKKPAATAGGGGGEAGGGGEKWPEYDSDDDGESGRGGGGEDEGYGDHFDNDNSRPPPQAQQQQEEDYFADEHDEGETFEDDHMGNSAPEVISDDDYTAEREDVVAPLGTGMSAPPPAQRSVGKQSASQRMRDLQKSLNDDEEEDGELFGEEDGPGGTRNGGGKSGASAAAAAKGRGSGKGGGKGGQKREKNERFKDVEKTGKWGSLSKWEIIAAVVVALGAIVAVVVVILVVVVPNSQKNSEGDVIYEQESPGPTAAPAPTAAPTTRVEYGYDVIKTASPEVTTWPANPEELRGSKDTPSASDQFKAAEFVLYDDPLKLDPGDPWYLQRYGLYNLYLSTGGETTWLDKSGDWPDGTDPCAFYGVECDASKSYVKNLKLSSNGLSGGLPYEIESLMELNTIDVYDNDLTGPLPVQGLIDSEKLTTLDVQSNSLVGTVPSELEDSNLRYFYIMDSGLTGDVPTEICGIMNTIVTNCDQNNCANTDACWDSCQGPGCWQ